MNDFPETSAITLWESGKAYLRGKIISYSTSNNNKQNKETELEQLQDKNMIDPEPSARHLTVQHSQSYNNPWC